MTMHRKMAETLAKYWDEDWELYSKVENHYEYLRDRIDFDQYAQFVEKDLSLPSTLLKMGPMLGLMVKKEDFLPVNATLFYRKLIKYSES